MAWSDKEECLTYEIKEYDLGSPAFKRDAKDLRIVCELGGKRYTICQQEDGLCRHYKIKCGFLGLGRCPQKEVIGLDRIEFLQTSGARCSANPDWLFGG